MTRYCKDGGKTSVLHHQFYLRGVFYSEIQLSVPILDDRLVAQFDRLIVTESGQLYIADWKTGLRTPDQTVYAHSWQTRV